MQVPNLALSHTKRFTVLYSVHPPDGGELFEVLQHLDRLHAAPHPGPWHRLLLPADWEQNFTYTVIRFVSILVLNSAFALSLGLNGALVEAKVRTVGIP